LLVSAAAAVENAGDLPSSNTNNDRSLDTDDDMDDDSTDGEFAGLDEE
jgi:hypothetical protein